MYNELYNDHMLYTYQIVKTRCYCKLENGLAKQERSKPLHHL